jgi:hypothetical protein
VVDQEESILDEILADSPAQLAVWDEEKEIYRPAKKWSNSTSRLGSIDTSQLHFVRVPENHVVIDFDLRATMVENRLSEIWKQLLDGLQRMPNSVRVEPESICITYTKDRLRTTRSCLQ